jgi:hypothetical protein
MHKLVDALVRLNDALATVGMRSPVEIVLENREQGLILFTLFKKFLHETEGYGDGAKRGPPRDEDFMDWCEIVGIKFRWPTCPR